MTASRKTRRVKSFAQDAVSNLENATASEQTSCSTKLVQSTFWSEGFHVRTAQSQGSERGSQESDQDSGLKCFESQESFVQNASLSKTSVDSQETDSSEFSETCMKSGMTRNVRFSARRPLVQHTDVPGYLYLPTPLATDWKGGSRQKRLVKSQLRHWITCTTGLSYPHPSAYEALMGFPISWTELDPSETQSSPKSLNGLEQESSGN